MGPFIAFTMRPPRLRYFSFCLATAAVLAACSGSETVTTAPDGSPLVFAGTVSFQGDSVHDFEMAEDGILTITLTDLRILLFDTSRGTPTDLVLGFGIGQRRAETGNCVLSTNVLIRRNQVQVYRLARDSYCLRMFDAGGLPEDGVVGYELQGEITR